VWYNFFILKREQAFAVKSNYFVILVLPYLSQIRGRQLWGTDVYTDDSDIVAGNIDQHGYESIDTPRLLFPVQISFTYRSCCSVKRRSLWKFLTWVLAHSQNATYLFTYNSGFGGMQFWCTQVITLQQQLLHHILFQSFRPRFRFFHLKRVRFDPLYLMSQFLTMPKHV
jgi:hypothetical protein